LRNNTDKGRQGEFFAAYILEKNGVEVHHVDRSGADLWCRINNDIRTVQVKAATVPRTSKKTAVPYYIYFTKNPDADYFCFVALDLQLMLVRHVSQITASTTRISPAEFNEDTQTKTIQEMIGGRSVV